MSKMISNTAEKKYQLILFMALFWCNSHASTRTSPQQTKLTDLVIQQISQQYPAAVIRTLSPIDWIKGKAPLEARSVDILSENGRGEIQFSVKDPDGSEAQGKISIAAWIPARVALKRIRPGELLKSDWFVTQNVNIAAGQAREFKGLIMSPEQEVSDLESTQSILEGQFLVSSAVRTIPDVRRGDSVRINLKSESMILTTSGFAQETGYLNHQIRVLTGKTKRELLGLLKPDGIVEVKL